MSYKKFEDDKLTIESSSLILFFIINFIVAVLTVISPLLGVVPVLLLLTGIITEESKVEEFLKYLYYKILIWRGLDANLINDEEDEGGLVDYNLKRTIEILNNNRVLDLFISTLLIFIFISIMR